MLIFFKYVTFLTKKLSKSYIYYDIVTLGSLFSSLQRAECDKSASHSYISVVILSGSKMSSAACCISRAVTLSMSAISFSTSFSQP